MRVVWQSWEGRFSDSPRVLFERWLVERPGDDHVWLADAEHANTFPAGTRTVPIYSAECVRALERSDVVVANTHTDIDWRKKSSTLYVQTWHGTPLKRVHHDVLWAPPGRLDRLSRDVARWDVLCSPNAQSTPRMRQAFRFTGEVMETGYPRNDVLLAPDAARIGRQVRHELGIADTKVVILYAPTWRDDEVLTDNAVRSDALRARIDEMLEQLGDNYCLLVRVHPLVSTPQDYAWPAAVRDVSRYPDISRLYLAADTMITDYSSTMFDYAVTGRPLLFFAYDLERFRDTIRGFYFDLTAQAPGPVVKSIPELVSGIRAAGEIRQNYDTAYRQFQRRYCYLEDGNSTTRILRRIWSGRHPTEASPRPPLRLHLRAPISPLESA
jgi:CDP-glycerol glycerophosphotransferase